MYVLSVTVLSFSLLILLPRDPLVCFISLGIFVHYKFTPLACFIVKYRSMSVIWICLFPLPVVCGWCGYPAITAVGLGPGCPVGPGLSWWAIISPWSWWAVGPLPVLFGPVPGDPGRPYVLGPLESSCPLDSPVEGLARQQWKWCALGAIVS